jgi:transposase
MADSAIWSERVAAWRRSGLSARAFAKDKGYSAGALYYWQRRVAEGRPPDAGIAFARVVRTSARGEQAPGAAPAAGGAVPLVLEFEGARLIVRPGFDRSSLAAILEELDVLARRRAS